MDELLYNYEFTVTVGKTFDGCFKVKLLGILNRSDERGKQLEAALLPICTLVGKDLSDVWRKAFHYVREASATQDFRVLARTRRNPSEKFPETKSKDTRPDFVELTNMLNNDTVFLTLECVDNWYCVAITSPRCAIGFITYAQQNAGTVSQAIDRAVNEAKEILS